MTIPSNSASSDSVGWVVEGVTCNGFSALHTWNVLRPRDSVKHWASTIWFKHSVPKHAFTMWIANLDRLPTRERLASWGLNVPTSCCLCNLGVETRDHMLIPCDYSSGVWRLVLQRLSPLFTGFFSWSDVMIWSESSSAKAPTLLRKMVVQASVFHIWKQRNNVLHNQISLPPEGIFRAIDREVRNIILSRRQRKQFHNFMQLWLT